MLSVSSDHHQALERFTIIISYLNLIARLARLFDFIVQFTTITSLRLTHAIIKQKKSKQSTYNGALCLTPYSNVSSETQEYMALVLGFHSYVVKDYALDSIIIGFINTLYKIQFLRQVVLTVTFCRVKAII